ncbi:MAG: hypothetical protein LBL55_02295 [Propionibacteriaceae bacterium]|jgi:hypothetical protein|nr:hypothetical protein [Propionibacteriaceae bacterium]
MRRIIAVTVAGLVCLLGLGVPAANADEPTDQTGEPPAAITDAATTLTLSKDDYSQNHRSGSVTVKVKTSADSWTAQADAAWVTLSAASGVSGDKVVVTLDANATVVARSAVVTFAAGDQTASLTLNQKAAPASLTLGQPESQDLTYPVSGWCGFAALVAVDTNQGTWGVQPKEDYDWLKVMPGNSYFTVIVMQNSGKARTGTIKVVAGDASQTLKIKQDAAPQLSLSRKNWTANSAGDSATIKVKSPDLASLGCGDPSPDGQTTWTAEITSGGDWLSVSSLEGQDGDQVTLTAAQNPDPKTKRTAVVSFTNGFNTVDLTVTQKEPFDFSNVTNWLNSLFQQILAVIFSWFQTVSLPTVG